MTFKKYGIILTIVLSSVLLCACNKSDANADDTGTNETTDTSASTSADGSYDPNAIENTFEGGPADIDTANQPAQIAAEDVVAPTEEEQHQRMLNVIRTDDPLISGAIAEGGNQSSGIGDYSNPDNNSSDNTDNDYNPFEGDGSDGNQGSDGKSKTPILFDVGDSTLFVIGSYNESYCDELIAAVNDKRQVFGLEPLEKNPSMCLVADVRAKESSYYNGHTRANGMDFTTVAPAYFKAECLSVTLPTATPKFIVDNWMQSKATRNNILSTEFKCIGASYFTAGKYAMATLAFGD